MDERRPEAAAHEISFANEVKRKLIHLFAAVIPLGYLIVPRTLAVVLLTVAVLVSLTLDVIRIYQLPPRRFVEKMLGSLLRHHESRDFTGGTYILSGALFSVILFPKPVAVAALGFTVVGDIAAALVGRRYGRVRFGAKSVEGSLACLAACFAVALVVPHLSVWIGAVGALVATIVEATSLPVDDNLSMPLLSGMAMVGLLAF